jgi:hypothetical protein
MDGKKPKIFTSETAQMYADSLVPLEHAKNFTDTRSPVELQPITSYPMDSVQIKKETKKKGRQPSNPSSSTTAANQMQGRPLPNYEMYMPLHFSPHHMFPTHHFDYRRLSPMDPHSSVQYQGHPSTVMQNQQAMYSQGHQGIHHTVQNHHGIHQNMSQNQAIHHPIQNHQGIHQNMPQNYQGVHPQNNQGGASAIPGYDYRAYSIPLHPNIRPSPTPPSPNILPNPNLPPSPTKRHAEEGHFE